MGNLSFHDGRTKWFVCIAFLKKTWHEKHCVFNGKQFFIDFVVSCTMNLKPNTILIKFYNSIKQHYILQMSITYREKTNINNPWSFMPMNKKEIYNGITASSECDLHS